MKTSTATCPDHVRVLVDYYIWALVERTNWYQKPTASGVRRLKTQTEKARDDQRVWSSLDMIDLSLFGYTNHHLGRRLNASWRQSAKYALGLHLHEPISDEDLVMKCTQKDINVVDIICRCVSAMIDDGIVTV